jgi:hypothetical protein
MEKLFLLLEVSEVMLRQRLRHLPDPMVTATRFPTRWKDHFVQIHRRKILMVTAQAMRTRFARCPTPWIHRASPEELPLPVVMPMVMASPPPSKLSTD